MFTQNTAFAKQFSKHKEVPSLKVVTEQVCLSVTSTSQRSLFICHYETIALLLPLLACDFFSIARSSGSKSTNSSSNNTMNCHLNAVRCGRVAKLVPTHDKTTINTLHFKCCKLKLIQSSFQQHPLVKLSRL